MIEAVTGRGWSARVDGPGIMLSLLQDWTTRDSGARPELAEGLFGQDGVRAIAFESSGLGHWDSSLLVFLSTLRGVSAERGVRFDEAGLPDAVRRLLALLPEKKPEAAASPRRNPMIGRVGQYVITQGSEAVAVTTLFGDTILSSGAALRGRARMRGVDLMNLPDLSAKARQALVSIQRVADQVNSQVQPLSDSARQTLGDARTTLRTITGAVDKLQVNAARTLGNIDQLAIETGKQVKTDGGDADTLVTSLNDMTGPRSPIRRDLESTLRDLSASAGSLRTFTRDLERNPLGTIMTKGSK